MRVISYFFRIKILLFCVIFFCINLLVHANDSLNVLTLEQYLQIVKKYHPIAQQTTNRIAQAEAGLTIARGGFDPMFRGSVGNKSFDGVNYYQSNDLELIIPTWYGIELQTGIQYLDGERIDPHETQGKTSYAGISVPLAKNLVMDKRRAMLKKAKILVSASEQEKRQFLNDLLLESVEAYWQWVQCYYVRQLYSEVINLNRKRFELLQTAFRIGERPAIDTIESLVQLQQFEYQQQEAILNLQNAALMLSAYLWKENTLPYELPENVVPGKKLSELFQSFNYPELETLIVDARKNHPDLMLYDYKSQALSIEKRLQFQELLPKVDLKYYQLGKGYNIPKTISDPLLGDNYILGLNFSVPLRLSQGRGSYKLAQLRLDENKLLQSRKEVEVINKVKNYYNQLIIYQQQMGVLEKITNNNTRLLQGEEVKYFNGESSLFLVNSRETKTLESEIKLIEIATKYNKTSYSLLWASGILWKLN